MIIRPVGAELFHGDTQTDGTKIIVVFSRSGESTCDKKRVNIIFIVKLEKMVSGIFRLLSEILPWRRLQVELGILKNCFKRHFKILIIKPTICTNFSNLFLE